MVNRKAEGISRSTFSILVVGIIVGSIVTGFTIYFLLQQGYPVQQAAQPQNPSQTPTLERIKINTGAAATPNFLLVVEASIDRGIWAKYNLDPEFVIPPKVD